MKVFFSLTWLYIKSFLNISGKSAGKGKPDFKTFIKSFGLFILILFMILGIGSTFIGINLGLFDSLHPLGLHEIVLLNAIIIATAMTLVIGFLTILSTYSSSTMEVFLLSMPIRPWKMLAGKFAALYVFEAAFSIFFMASTMVIFGLRLSPGFMFYIWGSIGALLIPIPVMIISYMILIPLLSLARFLRNKQTIILLSGLLAVILSLGMNLYFQKMMSSIQDPEWIMANLASEGSIIVKLGRAWPPAMLILKAMTEPLSLNSLLSILALAFISLAMFAIFLSVFSAAYIKTVLNFTESHIKKLDRSQRRTFLEKKARQQPLFFSLVKREFDSMNREPVYFLNGPFIVLLMPLIIFGMMYFQRDALAGAGGLSAILDVLGVDKAMAIAGLFGAFLGSGTSISATSLSRDAKALPFIKSLPLSSTSYMFAKLVHSLIFGIIGSAFGSILLSSLAGIGFVKALLAFLIALSCSSLLNLIGLWIDTINPRLNWDNPVAAMKQNPNSLIVIFGTMGLLGLSAMMIFNIEFSLLSLLLFFSLLPAGLVAILLFFYPRYARRKLAVLF